MIPYPDVTTLDPGLAETVCRMVRLVDAMRQRHPELDRFAVHADDPLDREALAIVADHVARLELGFELLLSPFGPETLPHGPTARPKPGETPRGDGR